MMFDLNSFAYFALITALVSLLFVIFYVMVILANKPKKVVYGNDNSFKQSHVKKSIAGQFDDNGPIRLNDNSDEDLKAQVKEYATELKHLYKAISELDQETQDKIFSKIND